MKNHKILFITMFSMILILGNSCVAPVNSSYESARTLGKGNTELMGHYTRYVASVDGDSETTNNNFGIRIQNGLTDKMDFSLRYILLNPTSEEATNVSFIALAIKYSLLENRVAASLPIGAYFYDSESTFFISPKLLFTYPFNEKFETTFASKLDIYFEEDSDSTLGLSLGFGISEDLSKWAIRPETGYLFDPGEDGGYWSFGVGFNYYIAGKK